MEKVSIIVPIYNAEQYLSRCIDSLVNQTHKNLEIILVNDGSTDRSLEICKSYAKRDKRIKVFSIKNSGVSVARNRGIQHSTGRYITFVDSDDWVEVNMIEFAVKQIKETDSDIFIWSLFKNYRNSAIRVSLLPGGNQIFEKDKDLLYLKSISARYGENETRERASAGSVWCKLYKKELITENDLKFNPSLIRAQDVIFSIKAFSLANRIGYIDKSLYHYRINESSTTSGTRFLKDTKSPFDLLLKEFKSFIEKNTSNSSDYKDAFYARTIQVLMWHLEHKYFHDEFGNTIFQRRKEIINLISYEPYRSALLNFKYNTILLPKKQRTLAKFFRRNFVLAFFLIYKLNKRYMKMKNRKFS